MSASNNTCNRLLLLRPILLGLFIGFALFSRTLSIGALTAFTIVWLFSSTYREKLSLLSSRKFVLLVPALFLLFLASLLYSEHSGLPSLEKRLLLLVLPFIIGSTSISSREIIIVLKLFVVACFIFTIVSFVKAYQFYNLPTEHFSVQHLPHQLSADLHAPYLSLLLVLANLFLILIHRQEPKHATLKVFLFIYLTLFILVLSSRTALFCNFLLIFTFLYLKLARQNQVWLYLLSVVAIGGLVVATFLYFPHFQERVTAISKEGNGISDRVTVFHASILVLEENPLFGVGIGDIQHELNKIYSSWNLSDYFFHLNSHNQYLDTGLAIGIPGIIFLLYLLIKPLLLAIQVKQPWYAAFYIIFLLAFMTEVVLSRYWGAAAFSLFYTIFTAYLIDQKSKTVGSGLLK